MKWEAIIETRFPNCAESERTEIGEAVIHGTLQSVFNQVRKCVAGRAPVHALTLSQHVNLIEHLVNGRRRLMYCANDCAAFSRQIVQQSNAVGG